MKSNKKALRYLSSKSQKIQHSGRSPSWKFQIAISPQRVIQSTSFLVLSRVLGVGRSNGATSWMPSLVMLLIVPHFISTCFVHSDFLCMFLQLLVFIPHKRHNRRVVQPALRHVLQVAVDSVHLYKVLFLQSSIALF